MEIDMRLLLTLIITFLFSASSYAETMIITKFDPGSRPFLLMKFFVDNMNTYGNERYVYYHAPGANGENAMERAIAYSSNRNILVYGGPSNFVYSELNEKTPERYMKEFRFVKLIINSYVSIFVHKDSSIKSITELVQYLKKKDNIYYSSTERINNPLLLNKIFLDKAGLSNDKAIPLRYKMYGEMIKALAQKETDYGIMNLENETELVMLMNSSSKASTPLSGISLGYPDFVYELGLVFFAPRKETKFDIYLKDIRRVCIEKADEIKQLAKLANYNYDCHEEEKELIERVHNDIKKVEIFKN